MEHEPLIRLAIFLGLFILFAGIEALIPRRARRAKRLTRWSTNWGIVILDTIGLRLLALLVPALAVGAAIDASANGWGLFNLVKWPPALEFILALLIFDLAIWVQHVACHKIPVLWRLHQVHHTDRDVDVSTAIRFHPGEIALSMLWKIALVYLLGPSAVAILVFEVLLNATALFNHTNMRIPHALDRILRFILVTPDMHRVHHSVHRHEHDSNYGFALSIWDRIFQTYRATPEKSHEAMELGLKASAQTNEPDRLGWALSLPFKRQ